MLSETTRALRLRQISPLELVDSYLARIEQLNPSINAFISVEGERARERARQLAKGPPEGLLWGIPMGIKDVIDVAGMRTTAASRILATNVAPRDSAVVEKLHTAGAIVLGKLNTHEFAYGALTDGAYFGAARNPWDATRSCGGSSGGSGAAIAADLVPATLGTDTAGSIRIPSSFCGTTGLRPTTGRVSNRGVIPVAPTFDTVGPIAGSAEDCARLIDVIAGYDARDSTSVHAAPCRAVDALCDDSGTIRAGVVAALFEGEIDSRVAELVLAAIRCLASCDVVTDPVEVPDLQRAGTIQQAIQYPEASAYHLRWLRERPHEYQADVRVRLATGLCLPPTAYLTGKRMRAQSIADSLRIFDDHDVLVAPTMPSTAPRLGETTVDVNGRSVPYRTSFIGFTYPWSLLGLPTLSVPCGQVDGLPVGLTIVGRRFEEGTVLRVGHRFQSATGWHKLRPDS